MLSMRKVDSGQNFQSFQKASIETQAQLNAIFLPSSFKVVSEIYLTACIGNDQTMFRLGRFSASRIRPSPVYANVFKESCLWRYEIIIFKFFLIRHDRSIDIKTLSCLTWSSS